MLAELRTDFPERFDQRRQLWGLTPDGNRRELQLEEHWFHKGGVVLKFAGVDSISDAERLARMELQIPGEQRASLAEGVAFVSEIVGCEVWAQRAGEWQLLGTVKDVQLGAGEAPLLMIESNSSTRHEEILVPYAEEFLKSSDLKRRRIEMHLPEGLLELDAPLSTEEKRRQEGEGDEARTVRVRRKPRRRK